MSEHQNISSYIKYLFALAILTFPVLLYSFLRTRPAIANEGVCTVHLLRDRQIIQEISEPVMPEPPENNDERTVRRYEREFERYSRRLEGFESGIQRFRERVDRSQSERRPLSIVFGNDCENYDDSLNTVTIEVQRSGPFRKGDVLEDGTRLVTVSDSVLEFLYPNGARRILNVKENTVTYIRPDGTKVMPGEVIELQNGEIYEVPPALPED
jgi:hypothetical protein